MPVKGQDGGTVYMVKDRKQISFDAVPEDLTFRPVDPPHWNAEYPSLSSRDVSFSGSLTLQRMSRKRFVSNLVKSGLPKKYAKKLAWDIKTPYNVAWMQIFFHRLAG